VGWDGGRPPGGRALAFGLLGGLVAWILHLGLSYALVPLVCGTGRIWILHLLTLLAAGVAGLATVVAWRARAGAGAGAGGDPGMGDRAAGELGPNAGSGAPREDRTEAFLALSGILLSGFFLLLILVEGLPALLQPDPCAAIPTLDGPIIQHRPGGDPLQAAALLHPEGIVGPDGFWSAWNLDPWVLSLAYLLAGLYGAGVRRVWRRAGRGRGIEPWRVAAYFGGVAALLVALVSPVDALGGELFSIHMVQHMLLMVVAPPLLVLGRPLLGYLWGLPRSVRLRVTGRWRGSRVARRGWRMASHPVAILVLHVGALWVWHLPDLYQAALEIPWLHHLEHASFFLTAFLFWWAVGESGSRGRWPGQGAAVLYVFATALQSGALGALLLFAREPWYPSHGTGAAAWGVDPLVDQQVAGAIMWVPAGLVYAGAAILLFLAWIRQADRTAPGRESRKWEPLPRPVVEWGAPGADPTSLEHDAMNGRATR
jgi:putative membrane protein